ncbi:uncharacterized protein BJ171DRAFT_150105 [Polychytrium aggregatum]|uniref:uncharacterized protein n=1 Tax=Polychytrium aggregatum TaxID=110093 RepID=UPI0022FE409A|nr:uncharacterized protein BJ171DRAFT_150105 [Polychytrium aggregatum]KAI9203332.1 hypothetical protein BJ171DRAFT_150105 [Polychytrium aggregatum]
MATQDSAIAGASKDLQEALFVLEKRTEELRKLKDEHVRANERIEQQKESIDQLEKELMEAMEELRDLKSQRSNSTKDNANTLKKNATIQVSEEVTILREKLQRSEALCQQFKTQVIDTAMEASRKHNDQQSQLQGIESILESIRREYDEFIRITKMENDTYRASQQAEYESLRQTFEQHKMIQFEEKKRLMMEYQGLLLSMQAQYDEYRTTAEFLFNGEISKLEDELSSQAVRYEQEILYVIQAKERFYAELMVSKDAKILSLIEGSDLQSLMQKHEMDIEALRKEHGREIERVKSDQESEQKNLISLLQRQNVSLESKCTKLQTYVKTLEARVKELVATVEQKNKTLSEREEFRISMEAEYMKKLNDANNRINILSQEKEHLRHKVIRLNLNAKGEGENSIENMLKRISRETTELHMDFDGLSNKYDDMSSKNQILAKKLRDRELFVEYLEGELKRRTDEYETMTRTFESFLEGRARQARRDRARLLLKRHEMSDEQEKRPPKESTMVSLSLNTQGVLRARIPEVGDKADYDSQVESVERKADIERGYSYLKRFKTLSKAFATGDFRILPTGALVPNSNVDQLARETGPWQKISLYSKLDDANTALSKLYKEPPPAQSRKPIMPQNASAIYSHGSSSAASSKPSDKNENMKLYQEKAPSTTSKRPKTADKKQQEDNDIMIIGGAAH